MDDWGGMKYTVEQILQGEDELILKYRERSPEVDHVLQFMNQKQKRLVGRENGEMISFQPEDILYVEYVDEKTFAYTKKHVIQLAQSLTALEGELDDLRYFRCSKSMIVNIDKVERLRSLPSNRIDAMMINGEHIMISRTYASDFRRRLKGGQ